MYLNSSKLHTVSNNLNNTTCNSNINNNKNSNYPPALQQISNKHNS